MGLNRLQLRCIAPENGSASLGGMRTDSSSFTKVVLLCAVRTEQAMNG